MSRFISKPPPARAETLAGLNVSRGLVPGTSVVHRFGHNDTAGTTFSPISVGGIYQTPQVAGVTTLRIKAGGDVADTAAGAGAREITLVGLDETGAEQTSILATAGASASSATTVTYLRLYTVYVSASGTYATAIAGSHVGAIVIENSAGGTDWGTISATDFPRGTSQIGAYSVPLGKTAFIENITVQVDNTKTADISLFVRENILEAAAPYSAMLMGLWTEGVADRLSIPSVAPEGPFPALTDIGFMTKVSTGTGHITIDFELLLVDA